MKCSSPFYREPEKYDASRKRLKYIIIQKYLVVHILICIMPNQSLLFIKTEIPAHFEKHGLYRVYGHTMEPLQSCYAVIYEMMMLII